jgi:hypothetical protein
LASSTRATGSWSAAPGERRSPSRSSGIERVAKESLPVGRIWNRTSQPVLRLITCGGFDRTTGHDRDNV